MPVSWAPPVHRASGQEVSLRALGKRLGSTSYFSLCLTATTLPDCSWLKGLTKGHSDSWLLVGGALPCRPMAEQDHKQLLTNS